MNFVREAEESGIISLNWIDGSNQIADMLTKPLSHPMFMKFAKRMGITKIN